ncbi:TetR/AcrR family transcriptional regulator [Sesbania bispinosa]|nr:TetR/AcrR family transcriptional regulator [Sesbania bispinosa]
MVRFYLNGSFREQISSPLLAFFYFGGVREPKDNEGGGQEEIHRERRLCSTGQ